jgi:hypothetical protein
MAVLQKNPPSLALHHADHLLSLGGLSLSEGDHIESGSHLGLFSELLEVRNWVRASTKYENQGRKMGGVLVTGSQVESRRLDEVLAYLLDDEVLDRLGYLV